MQIEYQNAPAGSIPPANLWLRAEMTPIPTGSFSLQKPNGQYVSCQPNGVLTEADAIGPWEAFVPDAQINVLRVGDQPRFAFWFRYVV
jgi:hypothetical protein